MDPWGQTSVKSWSKFIPFDSRKCLWKCHLENGDHFVSATMCSMLDWLVRSDAAQFMWVQYMCLCVRWTPKQMKYLLIISLTHWPLGNLNEILRFVIFTWILVTDGWGISCEIALIWMPLAFTEDQSTLVQVMAWCRRETIHYLSQCWPRSLSRYGVTRPQWVKVTLHVN